MNSCDSVMRRNIALVLEYEGTNYQGFQSQVGVPTIQGRLEEALKTLFGTYVKTNGAGRTDSGVHAKGQVVTFLTTATYSVERLAHAVNAHLPDDICVQTAWEVEAEFDPRRDAWSREYEYLILNRSRPSPLWRRLTYHIAKPLDAKVMDRAAGILAESINNSEMIQLTSNRFPQKFLEANVSSIDGLVKIKFEANYFLPHQVRRISGALVKVGKEPSMINEFESSAMAVIENAKNLVLPACGLYLIKVNYKSCIKYALKDR